MVVTDPIAQFQEWLKEARAQAGIAEPTAMCLATADAKGHPSARMVLLKEVDARGFVFYTNMESRKSRELRENPLAALCFHWMPLKKQVRIEGRVEKVSDAEANAYFASRPRTSQIGAWSKQSQVLDSRETLLAMFKEKSAAYEGKDVPRPAHWSGWRIVPERIEFWREGEARLHHRQFFTRKGSGWDVAALYP